ncbi:MAG: RelA/SpoT family protein, partial [Thiovulaceae bacterium]|nr:RelA/SpoT family protein [Sulfurimonadaceae bacterium]
EDTPITIEEIQRDFGDDVSLLVDGMTKIVEIRDQKLMASDEEGHLTKSALSFRKILLASTKDVRVLVVKLCDRLHNMLTLDALPPNKQIRIAEETMLVYAPIAHRLGVSTLKNKLEDLSFKYLFKKDHEQINHYLTHKNRDIQEQLNSFINDIKNLMLHHGFEESQFKVFGRLKHFYSIYLKMQRKGISIEEVLDLLAVRILVENPLDCYKVVGLIHLNYKPLMARFKDYISVPKENGYETIHTTVFDKRSIFEVQIRTFEMHQTAELGVAAHWKYKTGGHTINLEWLNNLSFQSEDVDDFIDLTQKDLYSEDITVYSPKGQNYTLPRGAVALDFAYAVHTDVGDMAIGASINKMRGTLLTELKNADMVEIKTGQDISTRCTWLDAVQTSKARHSISHFCRIRNKEIDLMTAVNVTAGVLNLNHKRIRTWIEGSEFVKTFYKASFDVAYLRQVVTAYLDSLRTNRRFSGFLRRNKFKIKQYQVGHLIVYSNKMINDINYHYCCHPKKGDDIICFKNGAAVDIHHKMCDVGIHAAEAESIMLICHWDTQRVYQYQLTVSLVNNKGALAKFLLFLANIGVDILSIELGNKKEDEVQYCSLSFETKAADISSLRSKIDQQTRIIDFVRADDIYQK